jgi:teichuronic acid biosynthesis protein TuaE
MKPSTSIRLRDSISADLLLTAFAIVASVVIGAMVTKSPSDAVALLVICAVIAIALTRPVLLFAAGIILLTIEPTLVFGADSTAGRPETFKLVLYACTLPLLLSRGIDRRKCAPLVAYGVVAVLTELLATPLPGLTITQAADSLATLCLGWLVFAINWDWRRDHQLLKVFTWVPILSVLVGFALQAAGILSLFRGSTPPRLEGATIAAWLGALSLYSVIACLALYQRGQWRWARWLGFVNVIILGATLSRGAVLALVIVAIPVLVRFTRHQLSAKSTTGLVKLAIAGAVAAVGVAVLASGLIERDENATTYNATRYTVTHEIASGRLEAWAFTYKQAKVNLAFGRGIGAGPLVVKIPGSPEGFTAQHNEYIHMLIEEGYVGGVILLMTIAMTLLSSIRRAPPRVHANLAAAGVAFAVFSFTENTLSAAPLAVAFLLVFGIACSRESLPSTGLTSPRLQLGRTS